MGFLKDWSQDDSISRLDARIRELDARVNRLTDALAVSGKAAAAVARKDRNKRHAAVAESTRPWTEQEKRQIVHLLCILVAALVALFGFRWYFDGR